MTYLFLITLIIPSVLIVITGIIYWMLKTKHKTNENKRHLLLVIISLLLLSVNAVSYYTYNNIIVDLENENKVLINDKENLQATKEKLNSAKIDLAKQIEDLNAQIAEHDEKAAELNDVIERLDNKNKELNSKNDILIDRNKNLEASHTNVVDNESANVAIQDTEDNIDVDNDGECNIKGSVNGIYHPPSSTYYSRTKNVAEWFCTTEEAIEAGYRAPYK